MLAGLSHMKPFRSYLCWSRWRAKSVSDVDGLESVRDHKSPSNKTARLIIASMLEARQHKHRRRPHESLGICCSASPGTITAFFARQLIRSTGSRIPEITRHKYLPRYLHTAQPCPALPRTQCPVCRAERPSLRVRMNQGCQTVVRSQRPRRVTQSISFIPRPSSFAPIDLGVCSLRCPTA